MTKKDFVAIAQAIKDAREALMWDVGQRDLGASETITRTLNSMAKDVAKVCATSNPKFDRERFLAACGVK